MSAPQNATFDAIALQLIAALEQYDRDTEDMIAAWPDLERYRTVSAQIEKIRTFSADVPMARVHWIELLIAHAELIHFLWRLQYGNQPAARAELGSVREHHGDCVRALRQRCQRLLAGRQPND